MMFNVAQTVAEVLIVIIYISVILTIVTSKSETFKNAFFIMFVATGFADVASVLASMIVRYRSELDLDKEHRHIVVLAVFLLGYTFIAHVIGNLLVAINRFSALCLVQKYDKIWSRKNVWIAIVFQYLISFLACIQVILSDSVCVRNADGICTGLEGLSKRTDQALLPYTVIVFVSTMLMCTLQITIAIGSFSNDKMYSTALGQFFWCNDIMMSIPPFSILLLSSNLRNTVFDFFRRRKNQHGVIPDAPIFVSRMALHGKI
uniref:G_PROTEIN_RECEP_F1_2 domain-containing protein n=1 Tax=Haemonchus contortus TaxID=6289 RepID=A0A912MQ29_HAECO|nr:7TM GPCR domain containing protein [Haemonchus contortus]